MAYRIYKKGYGEYVVAEGIEDIDGEILELKDYAVDLVASSEEDLRQMITEIYQQVMENDVYKASPIVYNDEDETYTREEDEAVPLDEIFRN